MEPKTENRKTFRLDADAAAYLAATPGYSNENAALNGLLRELPRKLEREIKTSEKLLEQKQQAEADGRLWKSRFEANRDELATLRDALQIVGNAMFAGRPQE